VISRVVVFAKIGSGVKEDVNSLKLISESGDVPNVSYDDTSCGVAELSPRFFLGSSQRPHLMTRLQKGADQIIS
jgi:hypothetical protein